MKSLVIGIDSSTTACKAIAWDRHGKSVAEGRSTYELLQPERGYYEQRAEDWWTGFCSALRELIAQIDLTKVDALSIADQRESFVPVDAQCRPTRNAILWLDERSRAELGVLDRKVGAEHLHRISGKPLAMTPSLPKIVWLLEHEPEVIARAYKLVEPHAFLVRRLTGEFTTSTACADPMGLIDMQCGDWSNEVIETLGLRADQFPNLVPPGAPIGLVTDEAAGATGLPSGLPVIAGAGDGQAAGLGANALSAERGYLNLGTAVIGGFYSAEYYTDPAFRTLNAPVPGFFLETVLRGGVFTVGWFVDKFAADLREVKLRLSPEEMLEQVAAKVPPGSQGLMLVPYWNNVMNPYWDPAATGVMIGWCGAHGREHFYRAIMEGIAFEQRLAGDAVMKAMSRRISEYVTMGGGSRSKLWCQIVADVTGIPILRSTTSEATCLGVAILAATAAGWYGDVFAAAKAMTGTAERFSPNPETQAIYDRLFNEVYRHLFPAVQPLVDRLTELTG
jgi:sugar (pentulose or hexulose) kinase